MVTPDESSDHLFSQFLRKIIVESMPDIGNSGENERRSSNTVIINGESGSGKTECARLLLKSLLDAASYKGVGLSLDSDDLEKQEEVVLTLINCGGIMESFGNARLVLSGNSSRFGRFMQLEFGAKGALVGGSIKSYLLENIRAIKQQAGEYNFHIFHRLLRGASNEERVRLRLDRAATSPFLPQVSTEGSADDIDLQSLKETMVALGILESEVEALLKVVAAVLHLGLLRFEPFFENAVEGSRIADDTDNDSSSLSVVADLLSITVEDLTLALTTRSVVSARETFLARLKVGQASHARDAVAKYVYKKAFDWVTFRLNSVLRGFRAENPHGEVKFDIGILDVFGFDAFDSNGLEQLCINYANETLQQVFNQHMFNLEMQEYEKECIPFQYIEYPDNKKSIEVIHSLFKILDDQCRIPNPTDKRLHQMLLKELPASGRFSSTGAQQVAGRFTITHFAGPVQYSTDGFIEKNTDEMPQDALQLIERSQNPVLTSTVISLEDISLENEDGAGDRSPVRRGVTRRGSQLRSTPSAVTQFQSELKVLLKQIGSTAQHFVRCINPVGSKAVGFDQREVAEQLQYGGILQAMQVSRSGYSGRFSHEDFYSRYRNLVASSALTLRDSSDARAKCVELVTVLSDREQLTARSINLRAVEEFERTHGERLSISSPNIPVGVSKVFLKKHEKMALDWLRNSIILQSSKRIFRFVFHRLKHQGPLLVDYRRHIVRLQSAIRTFVAARRFKRNLADKRRLEKQLKLAVQMEAFASPQPKVAPSMMRKRSSFFGDLTEADVSSVDGIPGDVALASKVAKQARERKNTAAKVGEYKKLDEKLLKEINQLIAAKRVSDETALLRFDIPRARSLLLEWSVHYQGDVLELVNDVAAAMDYGFQLLLPEKLVPMTVLGKMISLGRNVKVENRAASGVSKSVTKDHKLFKKIMIIMEKIKELIEKLQAQRKSMESVSKSRENYNSPLMICYKTIDFLRILHQYYYQYVIQFVQEYGDGSVFKQEFGADENKYVKELAALISLRQPLIRAEKATDARNSSSRYGIFPLTLSVDALSPVDSPSKVADTVSNIDGVVFRLIHCAPGIEYALNCLHMMLQQEVVMYPIRFIKLVGKSALNYGQIAFYQAATDFSDETLASVVSSPLKYDLISRRSYTVAFLSSLLSGALKGLPRNYMLRTVNNENGEPQRLDILGVINDTAFCTQLFQPSSYQQQTINPQNVHENILFTCPQLMEPVDSEIRAVLLSHPAVAAEIVSSWIRELYRQNVRYNGLVESGFTSSDLQRLMVPIQLPRRAAVLVYQSLQRAIQILRTKSDATHADILGTMHPELAAQYGILVQDIRNSASPAQKSQRLSTLFSTSLQTLKEPHEQFTIDRVDLENNDTSVEEVAIEFLKNVDFASFTDEKSLTSCAQIGDNLSFLPALWLRNITEEQLAVMFGVVIHMAFKTRKQKKENFGAKLFTKAIYLTGLDAEERRAIEESVIFGRIQDLLGMTVHFEDMVEGLKIRADEEEDYGEGIEDVKLDL